MTRSSLDLDDVEPPVPARLQPLKVLTWRHRLQARLMVRGCADPGILQFVERWVRVPGPPSTKVGRRSRPTHRYVVGPPPAPGEPLEAAEAGRLVGLRKRFALALVDQDVFQKALAEEREALASEGSAT